MTEKNSSQVKGSDQIFWAQTAEEMLHHLGVDKEQGLSSYEVKERQKEYGLNILKKTARKNAWIILINQFKNLIVLLLLAAAIVSFFFGDFLEGFAIGVVIV
ncbi:MAG: cation-transporting P-type ATPase, partial [candidate division WOR-3 bacterium]